MLLLPKSYNINLLESLVTFVLKSSRQKSLMAFFVLLMVPDWLLSLTVGDIWARRTWKWVIFYHCACGGEACCSEVCEGSEARANRRTKVREKQECASRSGSLLLGFFQPAKAVYTSSSSRGEERRPTTAKAKRVLNFCCRSSILLALVKVVVDLNATVAEGGEFGVIINAVKGQQQAFLERCKTSSFHMFAYYYSFCQSLFFSSFPTTLVLLQ